MAMMALARVVLALLVFVLLGEVTCRVLPVSTSTRTGYYTDPDVQTYPAHAQWQVSTGWDLRNPETLHSNGAGFSATREFIPDPHAVAFIGDSFIEASMLDAQDRPGAQLERELGGRRPVYAMGTPGTALLDYAERIRYAHERWQVRDFVILMETGDIRQALCGSGNVVSRCLDPKSLAPRIERYPEPTPVKRLLRESAFAQYLFSQLKLDPAGSLRRAVVAVSSTFHRREARPTAADTPDRAEVTEAVAHAFFERIAPYRTGRLVIIVDGRRTPQSTLAPALMAERQRFIGLARRAGAIVIDAEPLYWRQLERSPQLLSVGPYDGHLNPLGVRVVCAAIAAALEGP
ncbi:MAG: hypothetical protein KGN16_01505 [Burkholderiales bacterium]|nr:hypothetical protein [Burkholderiales bacterium]